ncbi:hypothetical protein H490_0109155 [Leucobacter sp. UCD-THU]|jgi:hypothetical protein|uniref:DUF4352 domain-containing protein n=1 Tax=Leucobacter muris TaxID=1935379 RepID=A0ABX5QCT5_9MICO|nr:MULTISPECIES: hypothetical protein [Leucobacter]EYT54137.1 hypothetical protein H490_0109155 [Leucobacter sp. UCD-THU]QAB16881.1 hypothetical protein Leucomu_02090 [Leucobacter muris]
MRVAAAFLADAANVREGTLSVLSGFINTINRESYPAPLGATLVIVVEYDESEARRGDPERSFRARCEPAVGGAEVFGLEGTFSLGGGNDASGYIPMVFPLTEAQVPMPGSYRIVFEGTGLERVDVRFYANATAMPPLDESSL